MASFLLVDDNPAVRSLLADHLRRLRPTVTTWETESIAGAMEAYPKHPFDAVFLGLGLAGGESGLALLRRMTEKYPKVRVVVHTSRAESDVQVREAFSTGAAAYLPKPVREEPLRKVLMALEKLHGRGRSIL